MQPFTFTFPFEAPPAPAFTGQAAVCGLVGLPPLGTKGAASWLACSAARLGRKGWKTGLKLTWRNIGNAATGQAGHRRWLHKGWVAVIELSIHICARPRQLLLPVLGNA